MTFGPSCAAALGFPDFIGVMLVIGVPPISALPGPPVYFTLGITLPVTDAAGPRRLAF
jgi:hypothetical protein